MSKNGKPYFWDWIGVQKKTDYTQLPAWLGHFIGWVFSAVALTLLAIGLGIIGHLVKSLFLSGGTNPAEDIRNLGLAAGAVIGVPFLIWRSVVAQKQVDVAEQGHITDRINKAVEGLGAEKTVKREGKDHTEPNLEVRIGALYALERISQDSARDHIQIMEILCAYIRQNADRNSPPLPEEELTPEEWRAWGEANRTHPPLDVDIALRIIERRSDERKQREKQVDYRLGLERAPLHALDLSSRDFTGANLSDVDLRGANLQYNRLQETTMSFADMRGAVFYAANFEFAELWAADASGSNLTNANFRNAILASARLTDASANLANFALANLRFATLLGTNFIGSEIVGADLDFSRFDKNTLFANAEVLGSSLCYVDLAGAQISSQQLSSVFADAHTKLPGGGGPDHPDWPAHWPKEKLGVEAYETAWRAWQAKIGFQPDQ